MSKIICDICGSSYPETSESCPICGYTREIEEGDDMLELSSRKGGRFVPRKKEIFDFDEVNTPESDEEDEDEEEEEYEDEEEEEEEESGRPNTFVVILLTILITGLLLAAGFIYVRFILPNKDAQSAAPTAPVQMEVEETTEATIATIPCETLVMGSSAVAQLSAEGQYFLLNVKAIPENTTDRIIYTSGDETVATVSEDGKITAVAEGETIVYISCGQCTQECRVVVQYVEETTPETLPAIEQAPAEGTIPAENVEPAGTEAATVEETKSQTVVDTNVKLKLKKVDISLGVGRSFMLELDCDLKQSDVEWSSEHPHIVTVDEEGNVTAVKWGTTAVSAKYGDQTVECIIRCK